MRKDPFGSNQTHPGSLGHQLSLRPQPDSPSRQARLCRLRAARPSSRPTRETTAKKPHSQAPPQKQPEKPKETPNPKKNSPRQSGQQNPTIRQSQGGTVGQGAAQSLPPPQDQQGAASAPPTPENG